MKYFDDVVARIKNANSYADGNKLYKEIREEIYIKVNEALSCSTTYGKSHLDKCIEEITEMILCGQVASEKIHYAMDNEIADKNGTSRSID